jgi:hypothetical protein
MLCGRAPDAECLPESYFKAIRALLRCQELCGSETNVPTF